MNNMPHMTSKGIEPLAIFKVNSTYILGVYQGSISKFDLLLKYRQKDPCTKTGWSRIRTPKHIHWAVDVLLKIHSEEEQAKAFLNFLINYWDKDVRPITSVEERSELFNPDFITAINAESNNYINLAGKGEYSVKFLLLIAKLLMFQEKTNYPQAYMFKKLLIALEKGDDIFKIVSVATHR